MIEINRIYCMDNVDGMSQLSDNFVDLTVTSPPYADLRKYDKFDWNFFLVAQQLFRVTKIGGVLVWVVSDKTKNGSESGDSFRQALYFLELGFNLHDTMIYKRWSGPLTHNRYEQEFEYMFVFSKGRPNTFNPIMIKCKQGGDVWQRNVEKWNFHDEKNVRLRHRNQTRIIKDSRIKGNVWEISNASQKKEHYGHPAPFPEQLAHDHIISWSNKFDLVLDPFMGSGTTAKVAKELGRCFIGFEISQKYVDIANERIK